MAGKAYRLQGSHFHKRRLPKTYYLLNVFFVHLSVSCVWKHSPECRSLCGPFDVCWWPVSLTSCKWRGSLHLHAWQTCSIGEASQRESTRPCKSSCFIQALVQWCSFAGSREMTWLKRPTGLLQRWEKDIVVFLAVSWANCWRGAVCVRALGMQLSSTLKSEDSGCCSGGLGGEKQVCWGWINQKSKPTCFLFPPMLKGLQLSKKVNTPDWGQSRKSGNREGGGRRMSHLFWGMS